MERYPMLFRRVNIVKMAILPKAIYILNVTPFNLPMTFFTELQQIIQKFIWNHKRPTTAKAILRNKNRAWGITPPDFRQYYKATTTKLCGIGTKTDIQSMGQNRKPRNKPRHTWQLIFDKGAKNIKWRKDSRLSKWYWENCTAAYKSMTSEHMLTPCTKINYSGLNIEK